MRISVRKCWSLAAVAALCLAAGAFAQDGTSTLTPRGVRKALTHSLAPAPVKSAASSQAGDSGKVSQKLFISVPESPSFLIFAGDMMGLAALAFLFRRRVARQGMTMGAGRPKNLGGQ